MLESLYVRDLGALGLAPMDFTGGKLAVLPYCFVLFPYIADMSLFIFHGSVELIGEWFIIKQEIIESIKLKLLFDVQLQNSSLALWTSVSIGYTLCFKN